MISKITNHHTGYAAVNGGNIYYEVAGEGEALLFIHGLFLDSRQWEEQFHELSKNFKVIRFDLRGFGQTEITEDPFTNYDDIKCLLEFLEIDRAHVVGLSFGSYMALELAVVYPELVQSLTLCSVKLSREETAELQKARQEFWETLTAGNIEKCVDISEQMWLYGRTRSAIEVSEDSRMRYRTILEHNFKKPKIKSKPSFIQQMEERLKEIKARTLIIYGIHDFEEYIKDAAMFEQQIKDSRVVCFDRSAHLVNLTEPQLFNTALHEFIREN